MNETTQPGGQPAGPPPGVGRWTRLVLVISLALNLLIAGAVLGVAFDHRRKGPVEVRTFQRAGLNPFAEALSRPDRRALRAALRARLPDLRVARKRLRQASMRLLAVLRATPFDPAAVMPALEDLRKAGNGVSRIGQALLINRLAKMSAAERAAYANRLERALRRGARRHARSRRPAP